MEKREKVIRGLECCMAENDTAWPDCEKCPYNDSNDSCTSMRPMFADAIELLKAQEPPTSASISSAIECLLHQQDADDSDMSKAIDTAVRAMRLLRNQEPRVMTLEEVKTAEVVFLEFQDVITTRIVDTWFGNGDGDIRLAGMDGKLYMAKAAYNDSWRCWTSCPTEEQRKAARWK